MFYKWVNMQVPIVLCSTSGTLITYIVANMAENQLRPRNH